jgi:isoaspartyl peptidase/L-asparaginase-like protein (Ntn-hydrolase superfamily)
VLMRQGIARRCIDLVAGGAAPAEAIRIALAELHDEPKAQGDARAGLGGLIVVTPDGELAIGHDTAAMSAGWIRPGGAPTVALRWR